MPNTQSEGRKSLENRVALRKLVDEEHLPTPKEKPVAWP